jgi:hypothetical protein
VHPAGPGLRIGIARAVRMQRAVAMPNYRSQE